MTGAAIREVVAAVPYGDTDRAALAEAFAPATVRHHPRADGAAWWHAVAEAEVAVVRAPMDRRYLASERLRWVHCDRAGLDTWASAEVIESGLAVTSSAGRSAPALAQHAFYLALSLALDGPGWLADQQARRWRGRLRPVRRPLWGLTLGVLGLGHTGRAMTALGRAFDMRVLAYTRRVPAEPVDVDGLWCAAHGERPTSVIAAADVLMLALGLNDATRHIVGRDELARMKPTSILVNMGRGGLVDEEALVQALAAGEILGAGLDVFAQEPLPVDHPLWTMPGVLVTPHETPPLADRDGRSVQIIAENARRLREGRPLLNQLHPDDLLTLGPSAAAVGTVDTEDR